jgi:hypothetical protein
MDKETFRKRYIDYSDDELILMLTKNASKYNPDALTVAKEILTERNVDIETILKNENEYDNDLSEEEIERRYIENLSPLQQIEYLANTRVNFEENIEEIVEENTRDLTDEELLAKFEEILNKVIKEGGFGDITDIHSKENYFITANIIEQRNIEVPSRLNEKLAFLNNLAAKNLRKRFTRSIIIGFIIFVPGLVFTIGTGGGIIFYGAILSGLTLIITGISGRAKLKRNSETFLESYSS